MFNVELHQVEKKHPSVIFHREALTYQKDNKKCFKVAVIYAKPGQKHPLEMLTSFPYKY